MPIVPPAHETIATSFTGTTPFPNFLLDTVMPTLKDTEWRLLCVIVRQTLGWRAGYSQQRKAADWLSHRQLKTRTGRSSAALCQAIDVLVHRHLIEVRDANQQLLLTPQSRRGYGGRLYFRLGPAVLPYVFDVGSILGDRESLKENAPKGKRRFSESEFHKAKTTKETLAKYLSNDKADNSTRALPDPATPAAEDSNSALRRETANPQVKQFLQAYRRLFKQHSLRGEPPVIAWGKDGKVAKELLKLYSYERLVQLLEQFFDSPNTWYRKQGYSLTAFKAALNGLLVAEDRNVTSPPMSPALRTGHWSKAVPVAQRYCKHNELTQQS